MKYLLVAFGVLAGSGGACAQGVGGAKSASVPLKQANVIVVRVPDSLSVAYTKMTRALIAAGYGLDRSDKESGYIQTTARPTAERKAVTMIARVALLREAQCTAIQVRGDFFLAGPPAIPISNRGMVGSPAGAAWAEIERIAKLYPGGIIAYRIER